MARIDDLRELRAILREALDEATVGVKAQLAAQYRATLAEIEEIEHESAPEAPKGSGLDEVSERRAAREAGAARRA